MSPPISTAMKPGWRRHDIEVGTILVRSIGCGCDTFYQVTHRTAKRLSLRRLEHKSLNVNRRNQTCEIVPIPEAFTEATYDPYNGGALAIKPDGELGPVKRLVWWNVWDGKPKLQYSS